MATSDGKSDVNQNARNWTSEAFNTTLANFLNWCQKFGLKFNSKVQVSRDGSCSEYGMVAVEDVMEGECLFQIPRSMLLHPGNCSVSDLYEKDPMPSKSGWAELLLALMYEHNILDSHWKPYFDLVPNFKKLDLPMFWTKDERETLLKGTGVSEAVGRDLDNISKEFNEVVIPYINRHKDRFGSSSALYDIKNYKRMVAFVMAYSFTEPLETEEEEEEEVDCGKSPPMMVPMADILNHVAKNNAHLSFGTEYLKMVATKPIIKGEEVFNTYGELANWHLLHMYGFAEEYPLNHFDTCAVRGTTSHHVAIHDDLGQCVIRTFTENHYVKVDIPSTCVLKASKSCAVNKEQTDFFKKKCDFLNSMNLLMEDSSYILGTEGVLTDDELKTTVKVLLMDHAQFADCVEKEGWSSDEEEDGDQIYDLSTYDGMKDLPLGWKQVLSRSVTLCMDRYSSTLTEDEEFLKFLQIQKVNSRKLFSFYTAYGQKKLLEKFINALS